MEWVLEWDIGEVEVGGDGGLGGLGNHGVVELHWGPTGCAYGVEFRVGRLCSGLFLVKLAGDTHGAL